MMANIIPAEVGLKDIKSEFTFPSSGITWVDASCQIYEKNGIVYFSLRGTFGETPPTSSAGIYLAKIPDKYAPIMTCYFAMFDTDDWVNPIIHAIVNVNYSTKEIVVNGYPSLANKKFVITGCYPVI